ncbi:MAG: hypothetical protein HKL84_01790 [Acidimicrobiaceae bacterium]|nr:hypothetical protein [Acidimicrobiaceae bacterium]
MSGAVTTVAESDSFDDNDSQLGISRAVRVPGSTTATELLITGGHECGVEVVVGEMEGGVAEVDAVSVVVVVRSGEL